ncbi:hypothetical protein GN958_ATG05861 [Phytophthora infestans]|uniref:3-dehydroquinate dehydratase n=1 Tax=Phytophthora infestans TaxID=4787 RepID=A0A8S9V0G8_PHYIN|nr:hypothetical protein GN958_ATG05861 [Phytophthora infestans]
MRRIVQALTGAGGRLGVFLSPSLQLQPRTWRCLSSAAAKPQSNPFEIDLNALDRRVDAVASTTKQLTLDDATRAAASHQAEAQHDIDLLHNEMSTIFGEEVAEYGGDTSSSSVEESAAAFNRRTPTREQEKERKDRVLQPPVTRAAQDPKVMEETSRTEGIVSSKDGALVNVLLLQGPCSFVRGVWTGGNIGRKELHRQIQAQADDLKIVIKDRDYYSEKIILQTLLEAREDQTIVLCWNISLSKSPLVVHALELIQSRVIIVSPSNVEHGPLPANVVGVLSGFWNQSISLALSVAAKLLESGLEKPRQDELSTGKTVQASSAIASSKKGVSKKKALTCYLCEKEGHIRSKCPDLPRNKV